VTGRYLLDTGIAGDFIYDRRGVSRKVADARLRGAVVGTCYPVVGELYFGAEHSATRGRNLIATRVGLRGLRIWPFDRAAAEEFGRLAALLERNGRRMQQIDVQIAAIALTLGHCTVVTTDTDLSAVPGLRVENWAA